LAHKQKITLGVSFGHGDSSAALVVDGLLVAAAEEERFSRIKHDARFPRLAVEYCLRHAGISGRDVTIVAIARDPKKHWWKKAKLLLAHPHWAEKKGLPHQPSISLREELKALGITRARTVRLEHHLAHLMSSRFLAKEETPAFISIDGLGDFASVAMGKAVGNNIEIVDRVFFPHSLGFFYTAMTQYLGFPHYGDEFKVMGLSACGKNTYAHAMQELVREKSGLGFELNLEAFPLLKNGIQFSIEKSQPMIKPLYSGGFLTQVIGVPPRKPLDPITSSHRNLAHSVQIRFEEMANRLLGQLYERVPSNSVALSGGCAHNSVWVGKIPKRTPFRRVYVAPASHDGGLAVGAAIWAAKVEVLPESQHWGLLGPSALDFANPSPPPSSLDSQSFTDESSLIQWIVEQLAQEKIGGLFQGRLELGPRALGSRSILADPRRASMKQRLNDRVKHREAFRPFAASVLAEHQSLWFKDSFECPSMEAVFQVEPLIQDRIPAVVHEDGSCRIQTVRKETQPFYWALIEAFRKKTGVPMILNTSFNDSEPIVCSPEDALKCFQKTDLDFLVVEKSVYFKSRQTVSKAS
jgi:carbamoyltransferase